MLWLVTTLVPWGERAKSVASKCDIELLTFQEKVARLIDFRPYLQDIVKRFENENVLNPSDPPVGQYYVEQRMRFEASDDAISLLPWVR